MKKIFLNVTLAMLTSILIWGGAMSAQTTLQAQRLQMQSRHEKHYSEVVAAHKATAKELAPKFALNCNNPLYVANTASAAVEILCSFNGDGIINARATFATADINFLALTSVGSYLYAHDGSSAYFRYTDQNHQGTADSVSYEFPGVAGVQRIFAISPTTVYAEDATRNRLFGYDLSKPGFPVSQAIPMPDFAGSMNHTVYAGGYFYTINSHMDAVLRAKVGDTGTIYSIYQGHRVSSIAVDNAGNVFIQEAGDCSDQSFEPMPVGPTPNPTPMPISTCVPSRVGVALAGSINNTSSTVLWAPFGDGTNPLTVWYSFQNLMFVDNAGHLYVGNNNLNTGAQNLLMYSYSVNSRSAILSAAINPDRGQLLGGSYITDATTFAGGPVLTSTSASQ